APTACRPRARGWGRKRQEVIQSRRIFKPDRYARRDPRPNELLLERLRGPNPGDGGRDVPARRRGDGPRARVARGPAARNPGGDDLYMALLLFSHVPFARATSGAGVGE